MADNKYVKILGRYVNGILHPFLVVEGYFLGERKEIFFEITGKKIDSKLVIISPINNRFILKAAVPLYAHKIDLVLIDDKKIIITTVSNNLPMRIYDRILYQQGIKVKRTAKIIKKICGLTYASVKNIWEEHHFIVPKGKKQKYKDEYKAKVRMILNKDYYNPYNTNQYLRWIKENEKEPVYEDLKYRPLISILIPVYNSSKKNLKKCLDSILVQHYGNFEVCLAYDISKSTEILQTLKEYEEKDKRISIVYHKEDGNISTATNSVFDSTKGEFVALMGDNDIIASNTLYEVVKALNDNADLDFIYSDEDRLDFNDRRCYPHFKPKFSPDTFHSFNYIGHFALLRTSIVQKIGKFKSEYMEAQEYDFFLRFLEQTTPERVYHIPKILYHWRLLEESNNTSLQSQESLIENGRKVLVNHMKKLGKDVTVSVPITSASYVVNYIVKKEPLVSIIIPTKDLASTLEVCLKSIYNETVYNNYEVIIINNRSEKDETFELFDRYKKEHENFKVIDADIDFNYSRLNNLAAKECAGDYLLFLNNDTEVVSKDWIANMVGYAMQKHIGAVGVKLFYPDNTIQHGGVVLSKSIAAHHAFLKYSCYENGYAERLLIPYDYSAVTAACMMVKRDKFNEVKGFEEELKVAYNDIDFCLKLIDKGYYNVFLPQVTLYHYESLSRGLNSTAEKYKIFLKEKSYFLNKWKKYTDNDPFYNPNLSDRYLFKLDRDENESHIN